MYYFQPMDSCNVTISLCNSATFADQFDTKLYVVSNMLGTAPLQPLACNDDYCSYLSQVTVSVHPLPRCFQPPVCCNTPALQCLNSFSPLCGQQIGPFGMPALCRPLRCLPAAHTGVAWRAQRLNLLASSCEPTLQSARGVGQHQVCMSAGCWSAVVSGCLQVSMQAGIGYGIIVDGMDGKFGSYQVDITAQQGSVQGMAPRFNLSSTLDIPADLTPAGNSNTSAPAPASTQSPVLLVSPVVSTHVQHDKCSCQHCTSHTRVNFASSPCLRTPLACVPHLLPPPAPSWLHCAQGQAPCAPQSAT